MMLSTRPLLLCLLVATLVMQISALPDSVAPDAFEHRHGISKGQLRSTISTIRSHYGKDYGAQITALCNNLWQPNVTQPAQASKSTTSPQTGTQPDAGTTATNTTEVSYKGGAGQSDSDTGSTASGDAITVLLPSSGMNQDLDEREVSGSFARMGVHVGSDGVFSRSPRSDRFLSRGAGKVKAQGKGRKQSAGSDHKQISSPGHSKAKAAVGGSVVGGAASSMPILAGIGSVPSIDTPSNSSTTSNSTLAGSNSTTPASGGSSSGSIDSSSVSSTNNQTLPAISLPPFLRHVDESTLKEVCRFVISSTLPSWLQPSSVKSNANGTWPKGRPWMLPTVTVTVTETVTATATPSASSTP
ncbi:uncharacterized protein MEPE_05569 [Melanopsichium pennsylvanicum]|uniref:Uncharacterized protein n=2 Tax=Melanopsichium pennsylvanicum TaxID=63383 RepID=A0AAJ4XQX6_9BASI|nr:uncharacterized protein BN887_00818 [Melanopsichium pennsylvanicum 4]SNX86860.1 uncharacterized protein MEPE_05569 [Melanopsichium pennsylvanicum]